ncbi:MAG: leucine-rich repeat domain-containing protein [Ruminococcus sp.]|nr:leucine-rich repeat domain-containing protein [Ruminococcus sp.]
MLYKNSLLAGDANINELIESCGHIVPNDAREEGYMRTFTFNVVNAKPVSVPIKYEPIPEDYEYEESLVTEGSTRTIEGVKPGDETDADRWVFDHWNVYPCDASTGAPDKTNPVASSQYAALFGDQFDATSEKTTITCTAAVNDAYLFEPEYNQLPTCTLRIPESYDSTNSVYSYTSKTVACDPDKPVSISLETVKPGAAAEGSKWEFTGWNVYTYDATTGAVGAEPVSSDQYATLFGEDFKAWSKTTSVKNLTNQSYLFEPSYESYEDDAKSVIAVPKSYDAEHEKYNYITTEVSYDNDNPKTVDLQGVPGEVSNFTRWTVYPYDVSTGEADTAHPVSADDYEKLFGPDFDPAKENTSVQNNTRDPYLFAPTYSRALIPAVLEYNFFHSYGNGTGPCVIQAQIKRIVSGTVVDLPATVKEYVDYGNDTIELVQPVFAWDYESSGVWFWNGHSYSRPFRNNNQVVVLNLYHENCPRTTGSISLYPTPLDEMANAMGGATGCENLETINLGEGIESVFEFYDNPNLATVDLPGSLKRIESETFKNDKKLRNITLPSGLQVIGSSSFKNCSALSNINIPDGIYMDSSAFEGSGLTHVTLPGNTQYGIKNWNDYFVAGSSMFKNCKKLWSVTMQDNANTVPAQMFRGCSSLTDVNLPITLQSIGSYAFEGCTDLQEITIPENVSTIGASAFRNCSNLESIVIPEGVTRIEKNTFQNCTSLESVTLPSTINYIDDEAFRNCPKLHIVTIPDNVTEIGAYAFEGCSSLDSINIPAKTETINRGAFANCEALASVNVVDNGETLKVLGGSFVTDGKTIYDQEWFGAFENCKNLVSIDLRDNTTLIGEAAFRNCSKLKNIGIGSNVTSIQSEAFKNCVALESITLSDTLKTIWYEAFANCQELVVTSFGNSLEFIGRSAFANCKKLGEVVLPETVTEIQNHAFYRSGVTSINIPDGVETIEKGTFRESSLNEITLGSGLKSIGEYAFEDCLSLNAPTFPNGLETIDEYAFYNCDSFYFNNLTIPGSVEKLDDRAFGFCSSLSRLTLCDGVSGIDSDAFTGSVVHYLSVNGTTDVSCKTHFGELYSNSLSKSVRHLTVRGTETNKNGFRYFEKLTDVTFENGFETIGESSFQSCENLKTIIIPDSVKTIDNYAFAYCVSLGDSVEGVNIGSGVETIGKGAFSCTGIRSLTIPDSVKTIDLIAFSICNNLYDVTIGDDTSLTTIDSKAFQGCEYLGCLTVPGDKNFNYDGLPKVAELTVTGDSINSGAFANWPNLREATIADSVKTVGSNAFANGERFNTVKIGMNVETLPASAFDGCPIEDVTLNGNGSFNFDNLPKSTIRNINVKGEALKQNAFTGYPELSSVNFDNTVSSIGANALSNCPVLGEIELPDSVKTIGDGAFQSCTYLSDVELGNKVTSIGDRAFSGCISLPEIELPDSVTTIGTAAFSGCSSLEGIAIPDKVTSVSAQAFYNCTSLETALLFEGVQNVSELAFANCSSLRTLSLPSTLRTIGDNAYNSCSKLKNLTIPRSVASIGASTFKDCTDLETAFVWGRTTTVGTDVFANDPDLTIYAYDSSPTDFYALSAEIPFFPIVNTHLDNDGYEDEPITEIQTVEDNDTGFGLYMDVFNNLEMLGVQLKTDEGTNDMRFVAVLNEGIVAEATRNHDIEDYGFVIAKTSKNSTYATSEENIQKITLGAPNTMTLSCRKTSNKVSGNYGIYSTSDTKYKYITLGIKNVDKNPTQGLAVRFYVKTHSGRTYYAKYNIDYTGCAASYSLLFEGDNTATFKDEWKDMPLYEEGE